MRKRRIIQIVMLAFVMSISLADMLASDKRKMKRSNAMLDGFTRQPASGPLRIHPDNSRYFTDGSGKAIYLTGSHTWAALHERRLEETPVFDYPAWLDFMEKHNHNFLRLWAWEHAAWMQFTDRKILYYPNRYPRTGPGEALDGEPKFDLTKFNEEFFQRLRSRVAAAGERGIYVGVMLFQGFSLDKTGGKQDGCNAFNGHPMNINNNINGINGDPNGSGTGHQVHTLDVPEITALQEEFIRKAIDTLNDLDNVLWEISNESLAGSIEWQYHMINVIHEYEKTKPKQHPVGMTGAPIKNKPLFDSPADWISPVGEGGYKNSPPAADGSKIVIVDSDHIHPWGTDPKWPWRCFLRGHHFITMDPYMDARRGSPDTPVPEWNDIRQQMGYTLHWANRVNLAAMTSRNDLASTEYCLANPGAEYLVYLPEGGSASVDLSAASGGLSVVWFNPATGEDIEADKVAGGNKRELTAPFAGHAVLYIQ